MGIQKSKRESRGFSYGKTYSTQRMFRNKAYTREDGYIMHVKRQYRRAGEPHRRHKRREQEWKERRQHEVPNV